MVAGGGTRLRRVLLRWQAPQPCPAHRATRRTRPVVAGDPYVNGYVNPYVIVYALGVRTPAFGARGDLSSSSPPQGEWCGRAAMAVGCSPSWQVLAAHRVCATQNSLPSGSCMTVHW